MLKDIVNKFQFDRESDRIGPDCLFTHWKLYFKSTMKSLCRKKFKYFGENAEFRPGAYAVSCSKICIGRNVVIRPESMLFADPLMSNDGLIIIEDDVMIGSGVHMYVDKHKFADFSLPILLQGDYASKSILIRTGSWIGANSIILPGVTIGKNSVVGAGSVVTKSIPDYCVAVGNPARVIKYLKN